MLQKTSSFSKDSIPLLRQVRSPWALRVLARLLLGMFCLGVLLLFVLPWQQNISGNGRVIAYAPPERQQKIEAPLEGRVTQSFVQEGSHVKKGDLLIEISDNDPGILKRLEQEKEALLTRLDAARNRYQAISDRIGSLTHSRIAAISAAALRTKMANQRVQASIQALQAAKSTLQTANINKNRQGKLQEQGLASNRTQELADLDVDRAQAEVARSQAFVKAAQDEEHSFKMDQTRIAQDTQALLEDAKASQSQAQMEVANAQAELTRIEVRLARQQTQFVKAPRDGIILRLLIQPGSETVKMGTPLVLFVPDTMERTAELWVDGNDIPLISVGRTVRLQFEGWPALQFSGWPSVSVGTFGGKVALVDAADDGKGRFRVLVIPDEQEPWPETKYLRQGTKVRGWILLNRVKLGYELWRQFNGFPPALDPPLTDIKK